MHPTISVQTDATHLNSIVNHPEVHPFVSGGIDGQLDLTPIVDNPDCITLLGEHGGQVYHRLQPGIFEAHSQCLPEGRGDWMLAATRKSLHWVFTRTEAVEVISRVPAGNLAARALAKAVHLQHDCTVANGWVKDGKPIPADLFSLPIQVWLKTAPDLVQRGRWFHARFDAELDRLGASPPPRQSDETRDRYMGAAYEMLAGSQPDKAAVFYNRVAVVAGWPLLSVVERGPIAVSIGSEIVILHGDDFFVLPPRRQ